jgi:hypothetical protein
MLTFWCCDMTSQEIEVEPMPGSTARCHICGGDWIITHMSAGSEVVFETGYIYLGHDLYGRRFHFRGVPSTEKD